MLAKVAGAEVCLFEPNEWRRKMAEEMGADHVYDPTRVDAVKMVKDLTGGYGVNMAVECSANEKVVRRSSRACASRGWGCSSGCSRSPRRSMG